jgi:hypothetical protein
MARVKTLISKITGPWKRRWLWLLLLVLGPIVVVGITQVIAGNPFLALLDGDLGNAFLGTVAEILAGVLAIVLSLTLLAVQIAADKYSPRFFSYFRRDWVTWATLGFFLVTVLVAIVSMGIQTIPMYQIGFLAVVWLFASCLILLAYYFFHTLRLLDPRSLVERLHTDGERALKEDNRSELEEAIASLGDVAVKAFGREEENVTVKCLEILGHLQECMVGGDLSPFEDRAGQPNVLDRLPYVGLLIVDQYYRVFEVACGRRDEGIAQRVAHLAYRAAAQFIDSRRSEHQLRGVMKKYAKFIATAIDNENVARSLLVCQLRELALRPSSTHICSDEQLDVCLGVLLGANHRILAQNDVDLWKEQLECFSWIRSLPDLIDSLRLGLRSLLKRLGDARIALDDEMWRICYNAVEPMQTRITGTNKRVLELALDYIKERVLPSQRDDLLEEIRRIKRQAQKLWITTRILDVFSKIGIEALYRSQYDYVKDLWIPGSNLVHLDLGFLTYQMVSMSWPRWEFDRRQNATPYVYRYYLLSLAHALRCATSDWYPPVPYCSEELLQRDDDYSAALMDDLRATYRFLMNLPHRVDEALKQFDTVIETSDQWDDIFAGQARNTLEDARAWLENEERRKKWAERVDRVVGGLPLDNRRVSICQDAAKMRYEQETETSQLTVLEKQPAKSPTELTVGFVVDSKCEFTMLVLDELAIELRNIGSRIADCLIAKEKQYVADTLLGHPKVADTKAKRFTLEKVKKAVASLRENGYEPGILLIPKEQLVIAYEYDPEFRLCLSSTNSGQYLLVDDDTKLKILKVSGNHALVMNREAGTWTIVEPFHVEVVQDEDDRLKVQVVASEIAEYRVQHPEAARIVKLKSLRRPSS